MGDIPSSQMGNTCLKSISFARSTTTKTTENIIIGNIISAIRPITSIPYRTVGIANRIDIDIKTIIGVSGYGDVVKNSPNSLKVSADE